MNLTPFGLVAMNLVHACGSVIFMWPLLLMVGLGVEATLYICLVASRGLVVSLLTVASDGLVQYARMSH